MNHNPRRGFKHYRFPSKVFWKVVRGMLRHKTDKAAAALGRMKVFEGIPAPYDAKKRQCVPDAMKVIRLKNYRPFCVLGDLCASVGWNKKAIVEKLENKRKQRSLTYYKQKLAKENLKRKALGLAEIKKINEELAKFGY